MKDYRARIYERYLTLQLESDPAQVRKDLAAGQPFYKQLIHRFFPTDRETRILDLGCGFGGLLFLLKEMGYTRISGVDISHELVELARELGIDSVREGDLTEALRDFADGSFEIVIALDILEHFSKEEIMGLLDEILRVLAPGGKCLIHVPNGEAIFSGKIVFGDFTHQTAFTQRSITEVLKCCGFGTVRCYEDSPVVHGIFSGGRFVLWKFISVFYRLINLVETGYYGPNLILSQNLLAVARKPNPQ